MGIRDRNIDWLRRKKIIPAVNFGFTGTVSSDVLQPLGTGPPLITEVSSFGFAVATLVFSVGLAIVLIDEGSVYIIWAGSYLIGVYDGISPFGHTVYGPRLSDISNDGLRVVSRSRWYK